MSRLSRAFKRALINVGLLNTHDINLVQPDGLIHVFSDGSYSKITKSLGYAAVIKTTVPNDEIVLYDHKPRLKQSGGKEIRENIQNIAAELFGVITALESLPAKSNVLVHTDFMEIEAYLNGKIAAENLRHRKHKKVWERLEKAVARHASVVATRATDNDKTEDFEKRRIMRIAHNFSVLGSGSTNLKLFLTEDDEAKYVGFINPYRYDRLKSDHSHLASTDGALDIVEINSSESTLVEFGWGENHKQQPDFD